MRRSFRSVAEGALAAFAPWRRPGPLVRRRLDWLVLMPAVDADPPAVDIVGSVSDEDRRRIATHFSAAGELGRERVPDRADVVISLGADVSETTQALARLAPSGAAFVTTTRHRDRRRILRSVDSTGQPMIAVSAHWMVPSADAPRRFIPLGGPEPLRWYLRNLFAGESAPVRLIAWLLSRSALRAPHLIRRQALVMAGSESRSAGSDLLETTSAVTDGRDGTDAIVITSGFDSGSRSVIIPFDPGSAAPQAVVKVAAHVSLNALTRNEQAALAGLRAELPPTLAATIPRPMGDFAWRGRSVGVESAFDGPTLAVFMIEKTAHEDQVRRLRQVGSWLAKMHDATLRPGRWDDRAHERWILETTSRARSELQLTESVEYFLDRLEAASRSLIGLELPTVRRHFDLGPWNIIMTEDDIGVIDWEYGRARSNDGCGLPLCDLEYFVKYWLHAAARTRDLDDELGLFHCIHDGHDEATQRLLLAARSEIERGCDASGIDRRFMPVLGAYEWIEQAVNRADRTRTMGAGTGGPNSAREYLPVLAEHLRFESR